MSGSGCAHRSVALVMLASTHHEAGPGAVRPAVPEVKLRATRWPRRQSVMRCRRAHLDAPDRGARRRHTVAKQPAARRRPGSRAAAGKGGRTLPIPAGPRRRAATRTRPRAAPRRVSGARPAARVRLRTCFQVETYVLWCVQVVGSAPAGARFALGCLPSVASFTARSMSRFRLSLLTAGCVALPAGCVRRLGFC